MKILLVDIGNTLIKIAMVFDQDNIIKWPIIKTQEQDVRTQLTIIFKKHAQKTFDKAIISCVVSNLLLTVETLIVNNYQIKPLIVNFNIINQLPLKINLDNCNLGSDLIALAVGADSKYDSAIVVCLGTATTYSIIINSELVGVVIGPGFQTSKSALVNNADLITNFEIQYYPSLLGKNTNHALSIGYGYGFNAMIKGTINQIQSEVKLKLPVLLTGGNVAILKPYFDFPYHDEPEVLWYGLLVIAKILN